MYDKLKSLLLLSCCLLILSSSDAQDFDPVFSTFKGTVYKIPARKIAKGYTSEVMDFKVIAEIELEELNIPERQDDIKIPGVPVTNAFGIVFTSAMEIVKAGNYTFSLSSDDGSRLYINKKSVINNDKLHKMREMRDTTFFKPGKYPVKVWFFQGVPDRYGLILKAHYLNEGSQEDQLEAAVTNSDSLVFDENQIRFAYNSFEIDSVGLQFIDQLAKVLNTKTLSRIIIKGHTDSQGSQKYNQALSLKRAEALKNELALRLKSKDIAFNIEGIGESQPTASNETPEGRAQNRRVEVLLE